MSVTVVVEFQAQGGKGGELADLLQSKAYPSIKQAGGFGSITLNRDIQDADHLIEIERWDSAEQYDAWLQPALAELGPSLMPLLAGQPKVTVIDEVASA